jgi:hypothetical protein
MTVLTEPRLYQYVTVQTAETHTAEGQWLQEQLKGEK